MSFEPRLTVSQVVMADLKRIDRARGLLEAVGLSQDWTRQNVSASSGPRGAPDHAHRRGRRSG